MFEDFLVFDFGGNEELPIFLSDIKVHPGFEIVESLTIVRDSETNFNSAINSIKSALERQGFPVPAIPNTIKQNDGFKIAFSLFPALSKDSRNGTLEDLIMENLSEDGAD